MAAPVLITGAGGLIGSWLLRHWPTDGPPAHVVRHADVDLLAIGAAGALVERVRPQAVVHLAWVASGTPGYRSSPDNARWLETTIELQEACGRLGIPIWATGSVVDDDPAPADDYTAAKVELRRRLHPAISAGDVGLVRPYYVFDETAGRPAALGAALAARDAGIAVTLQTPENRHDFVHASDVARAVVVAVEHRRTGYLPVGSGRTHRVADLVSALGVPWRSTSTGGPEATHADAVADIGWLQALGWQPITTEEFFADD